MSNSCSSMHIKSQSCILLFDLLLQQLYSILGQPSYVVRVLCDGRYVVRDLCDGSYVVRVLCDGWYVVRVLCDGGMW